MVEITSLVVAVISLVGTIIVAGATAVFQFLSDERKRLTETEKLVRKYRDPVLWAANELQSRLYNICDQNVLALYHVPGKRDLVVVFTAYLVGQYLTWTSIFRRQAQFLSFASKADNQHKRLNDLLIEISNCFLQSSWPLGNAPFMLWRGQQSAIGEIMTVREGDAKSGELFCMGYATFSRKWTEDEGFRSWFVPIEQGIAELLSPESRFETPTIRLMYLQHLLHDLLNLLDPNGMQWDKQKIKKCRMDDATREDCKCQECKSYGGKPAAKREGEV